MASTCRAEKLNLLNASGFPFVTWRQTEASAPVRKQAPTRRRRRCPPRRFATSSATRKSSGASPALNVGLRADYVDGNDAATEPGDLHAACATASRLEFVVFPERIFQAPAYDNYDHGDSFGTANSVCRFQLEFGLGAHGAHKY